MCGHQTDSHSRTTFIFLHTHTDNTHLVSGTPGGTPGHPPGSPPGHPPGSPPGGGTPKEGSCKCVASLNASNLLPTSTLSQELQEVLTGIVREVLPDIRPEVLSKKVPVSVWPV